MDKISELREECISYIMSLTSPVDVIRSAAVSKRFLSATDSEVVWDKFLPPNYRQIICESSSPSLESSSKKDLFFLLCCHPLLIKSNTMSFALDKKTGKKCYMLGARALSIAWGDTPMYWTWKPMVQSRFPEVAELISVCWLEIKGEIHTKLLTPNTTYGVYFVFKLRDDNNYSEFTHSPVEVSIMEYDEDSLPTNGSQNVAKKNFYLKSLETEQEMRRWRRRVEPGNANERDDGWMDIEMGKYEVGNNGANDNAILEMSLKEIKILNCKSGLIVHGIEVRPLE